ncbi:MAG: hypothetical protein WCP36_10150 [Methanomicrobiales archaeon]
MSETTYSTEECSLDALENDRIRSNAYVAFFTQKTQADANRFIYGVQGGGLSPSNPGPLIDARMELSEKGYIHRMNEGLRNVPFRSSVGPIINSIHSDIKRSGSYFDLDSEKGKVSIRALTKVLDSEWFRQFFSYHAIHNPYPGKNKGEFYSGYAGLRLTPYEFADKSYNAVEVWYIKKLFLELIAEIGTYSYYLNSFIEKNADVLEGFGYRPISPEEIVAARSFDDLCASEMNRFCRCWVDDFYKNVNADDKLIKSFVTAVVPVFDVPKELHRRGRAKKPAPADVESCASEQYDMRVPLDSISMPSPKKVKFQKTRKNPPYPVPEVTSTDISIPPGLIERIKFQSACIPTPVAGIMRMSYPLLPKGIGERCTYAECQLNKQILGMDGK